MESDDQKVHRIDLRVSARERKQIDEKAKKTGVKVSEYLRRSALGIRIDSTPEGPDASGILSKIERAQLASIANNLNQLTRHAHAGQLNAVELNELIGVIKELLK